MIKKIVLIIIFFLSIMNIAYSKEKININNINFQGLQRVNLKSILNSISTDVGKKINYEDIHLVIKSLFNTGNFKDIKVFYNKNLITIKVKERPKIIDISFKGNIVLDKNFINKILEENNIKISNLFDEVKIHYFKKKIEDSYYDIGKYNCKINILIEEISNNCVNIKIFFHEGKSARIKKINITGNRIFSNKHLFSLFRVYNQFSLENLLNIHKYQKKELLKAINDLRNYYLNLGYAQFVVNSTKLGISPNKKNLYVSINITEGNKCTIKNVHINCNNNKYYSKIKDLINFPFGSLYNFDKIEDTKNEIKNLLNYYGYSDSDVIIKQKINYKDNTVKLSFNINIGNRLYVSNINFEGNYKTQDLILRNQMVQLEGSWLNKKLLKKGKKNLNSLDYFKSVDVDLKKSLDNKDEVDIIYKIKEKDTDNGNIKFNVGLNIYEKLNFTCNMQQDNISGTGNLFTLNFNKNKKSSIIKLTLVNPFYLFNNITFNGELSYEVFNNSQYSCDASDDLRKYKTNIFLNIPIYHHSSINIGSYYLRNTLLFPQSHVEIKKYLTERFNINFNVLNKNNEININESNLFYLLEYNFNKYNKANFVTKGDSIKIAGSITAPKSMNKYYQIHIDIINYIPLNLDEDWLLIYRSRFNYIDKIGKDINNLFFYNKYYSGDSNAIRGFLNNSIGIQSYFYNYECNYIAYELLGGSYVLLSNIELVFPAFPLTDEHRKLVRTSFFIDIGSVFEKENKKFIVPNPSNGYMLDSKETRISTGISLRWSSPFGLISISYAKYVKKYQSDRLESLQFSIDKMW